MWFSQSAWRDLAPGGVVAGRREQREVLQAPRLPPRYHLRARGTIIRNQQTRPRHVQDSLRPGFLSRSPVQAEIPLPEDARVERVRLAGNNASIKRLPSNPG